MPCSAILPIGDNGMIGGIFGFAICGRMISAPTMGVCGCGRMWHPPLRCWFRFVRMLVPLVKGGCRANARQGDSSRVCAFRIPPSRLAPCHGRLSSKCNTFFKENFSRSFPPKTFAWSVVNQIDHEIHIILFNAVEIKPLWKEKA